MDENRFWQIIETSREGSGGNNRQQAEALKGELKRLPLEDLRCFNDLAEQCHERGLDHHLLNALRIIHGDGWAEDLCAWLVAHGRSVFEQALADPDSLADLVDIEDADDETLLQPFVHFLRLGHGTYQDRTGEPTPWNASREIHGSCIHDDHHEELARCYPRLWAKIGDRAFRRVREASAARFARSEERKAATGLKWMDFSGAPPILAPERCLPYWNGYYLPSEPDPEGGEAYAELALPDGRRFDILDDFDFQNPRTDYERACALSGHQLFRAGPSYLVVINDYSDGPVAWWAEQRMILTVSVHLPDLSRIADSEWKDPLRWTNPSSKLLLMNSCVHGADPSKFDRDHVEVTLEPGEYVVDSADYTHEVCVMVYRFRRLP